MKKLLAPAALALFALTGGISLSSCEEGALEEAGEELDEVGEDIEEGIDDLDDKD